MTKTQLIRRIRAILDSTCEDPGEAMIKEGNALVKIGETLKGMPLPEARAVLRAVAELEFTNDRE